MAVGNDKAMEYFTVNELNGDVSVKRSLTLDTDETYSVSIACKI